MTVEDLSSGMQLSTSAGWNQLEEDWRFFLSSPGSGVLLARRGGRVSGTVAYLGYDRLAWIAMMLVDPQDRGTGIGTQLLQRALAALRGAPCAGLDATPLGAPLYRRAGLVDHYSLVRTKGTAGSSRLSSLTSRARPMAPGDLEAVFERDREVFGADRSALLTSFLARSPECAWVVDDQGAVAGYSFGRPGRLFHQVGPVVAQDRDTARELTASCLSQLQGRLVAIDAPSLDAHWLAWLESAGFAVERPFVRMFLAGHRHPGTPQNQYAIAGPEFA